MKNSCQPSSLAAGGSLLLDGAMGTMLQSLGLGLGESPERWNLTHPQQVRQVHRAYLEAGSQVIYTNTFGANRHKLSLCGLRPEEVIPAAVQNAREAITEAGRRAGEDAWVALDVGPIGELLEPTGSLPFEKAVALVRQQVRLGLEAGADLVVLETLSDLYEAKAGVLGAREAMEETGRTVPLWVTMTFEPSGRTFTGCGISAMALTLDGLGVDALGFNCSLGPRELLPFMEELRRWTDLPLILKPNAGLPDPVTGEYGIGPEEFGQLLEPFARLGVQVFGGCCGTNPDYLRAAAAMLRRCPPQKREPACRPAAVCSPGETVVIDGVRVIGERLNPTGKKRMKQALLEGDMDYLLGQGIAQVGAGAAILDVNVGAPGVDEPAVLPQVVQRLQGVLTAPLQLDSSDPKALEAALRVYNGKPIVNSVNGEEAVLKAVLPLVKRYGAAVVGLCLDEKGIPSRAEDRLAIARRILDAALALGIPRQDVFIDCLTLTASVQQQEAGETLRAVRMVRQELGLHCVLGVSNISFGLPNRELLNRSFLLLALEAGLDLPILNPNTASMMDAVSAYELLSGADAGCGRYIARFSQENAPAPAAPAPDNGMSLEEAVAAGLGEPVRRQVCALLEEQSPEQIIQTRLIPALDRVGAQFEAGTLFLPQMIQAAQAAQAGFDAIKNWLAAHPSGEDAAAHSLAQRGIVLATVKGDIHDIGKNIVKVILENYGFPILDLGRDVPPGQVVQAVQEHGVRLVGLSALMTTTLKSMEETIALLRRECPGVPIMVGGAVLTPEYARAMGADFYAKDAKASVDIARQVLLGE